MRTPQCLGLVSTLALALCCLGAGRTAHASPSPAVVHVAYVALGDSFTTGHGADDRTTQSYPALLAQHLPPGAGYLNLGVDGMSLHQALAYVIAAALAHRPALATVWLGAIDLLVDGTRPAPYRADLERLLSAFQRAHVRVFIANMPDPLRVPATFIAFYNNINGGSKKAAAYAPVARAYNAAIAAVAARHGAMVVDVYAATPMLWGRPGNVSVDGIHLDAQGYAGVARLFYGVMHHKGAL